MTETAPGGSTAEALAVLSAYLRAAVAGDQDAMLELATLTWREVHPGQKPPMLGALGSFHIDPALAVDRMYFKQFRVQLWTPDRRRRGEGTVCVIRETGPWRVSGEGGRWLVDPASFRIKWFGGQPAEEAASGV